MIGCNKYRGKLTVVSISYWGIVQKILL